MNAYAWIRVFVFQLSQTEFARLIGTGQNTVSRWESGESEPRLHHIATMRTAARERGLNWDDRWIFESPADAA